MKPSHSVQQECENIISEISSLLKHTRSCQFLPNINTVESMDKLQKLNIDLISILDKYFDTNIWTDFQWNIQWTFLLKNANFVK